MRPLGAHSVPDLVEPHPSGSRAAGSPGADLAERGGSGGTPPRPVS